MCLSYREIRNEEVTVRKGHRCGWGSESITKGERARYRTYVFDGDFTSDWMHPESTLAKREVTVEECFAELREMWPGCSAEIIQHSAARNFRFELGAYIHIQLPDL